MTTVNAFTATAASMPASGDNPDHIRTTFGLSTSELDEALQHAGLPAPTQPGTETASCAKAAAADGIEALLAWAENHIQAGIRNRAARVRADLTELTERRTVDAAQRQAEARVARARAELEAAQAQLRQAKTSGRTATSPDRDAAPHEHIRGRDRGRCP